ncbi:MAG: Rieske 2Fe-2S domain-containing protein [bacterium]|nr:Rieske 2Fe-2S domain-containing protein [bacterium]MDT8395660.1 Rieske 2Fe-2S domain-containing protein [bacterium]
MTSPARSTYRWTDYLLGLLILIAAGAVFYPTVRFLQPGQTPPVLSGTLIPAANLEEIPPGQALEIEYASTPWILVKKGHEIVALSGVCTYRGSELVWDAGRNVLVCSGHGCTFDRHGNVLWGLATRPLETLPVRIEGNRVHVAGRAM